jgi:hypothetical protein
MAIYFARLTETFSVTTKSEQNTTVIEADDQYEFG